jgi:hypothetical protein
MDYEELIDDVTTFIGLVTEHQIKIRNILQKAIELTRNCNSDSDITDDQILVEQVFTASELAGELSTSLGRHAHYIARRKCSLRSQ